MKVSLPWLQKYFDSPLPPIEEVSDALTFHVFEIDEVKGDMLDVKVLPDRASYGLSHRGIARELSAILNLAMKSDPLRETVAPWASTNNLPVTIEDPKMCGRYIAAVVRGVTVGPSPEWLKSALESVGQRSINNVVDATNFVMLNIGQPLHAFDAAKVSSITVRFGAEGEQMTALGGAVYTLPKDTLVIADKERVLGIAGVKGGTAAEITSDTTDIIIEAANFDGTAVRKTAQALKLFTDASLRFQNKISPELAGYGMRDVLSVIADVAGGTLEGVIDLYPGKTTEQLKVGVSVDEVNKVLGTAYSVDDIQQAFSRLALSTVYTAARFEVIVPFERNDLKIKEDLIEEVGRIIGYDKVQPVQLSPMPGDVDQNRYHGIEKIKDFLVERGYTEVSTQSFAKMGTVLLANPLDVDRPYLRTELAANMAAALEQGKHVAPLITKPKEKIKLFEIGTVFNGADQNLSLVLSESSPDVDTELGLMPVMKGTIAEYDLSQFDLSKYGEGYMPKSYTLSMYKPFSIYPFVLRDIAVWVPEGVVSDMIYQIIQEQGGALLTQIDLFDQFSKEGRTSYAFRLVFQSMDRTLTDTEVGEAMTRVTATLNATEGWQVR